MSSSTSSASSASGATAGGSTTGSAPRSTSMSRIRASARARRRSLGLRLATRSHPHPDDDLSRGAQHRRSRGALDLQRNPRDRPAGDSVARLHRARGRGDADPPLQARRRRPRYRAADHPPEPAGKAHRHRAAAAGDVARRARRQRHRGIHGWRLRARPRRADQVLAAVRRRSAVARRDHRRGRDRQGAVVDAVVAVDALRTASPRHAEPCAVGPGADADRPLLGVPRDAPRKPRLHSAAGGRLPGPLALGHSSASCRATTRAPGTRC